MQSRSLWQPARLNIPQGIEPKRTFAMAEWFSKLSAPEDESLQARQEDPGVT